GLRVDFGRRGLVPVEPKLKLVVAALQIQIVRKTVEVVGGADEPAIEIEPGFLRIDVGLDPCELRRAVASSCGIAVVRIAVVGVTVVGITPAPTPSPSARHNHGAVTSVPAA